MAPRRQTKQTESVAAVDIDAGDASPPKKKKTTATTKSTEDLKPTRTRLRQTKIDKNEQKEAVADDTSPTNKPRRKAKKMISKPISEPKVKLEKIKKLAENNDVNEKKVIEKKTRAKSATTKKAGTKEPIATKTKVKAPVRKPKEVVADEDDTGDGDGVRDDGTEKIQKKKNTGKSLARKTRAKVEKESDAPTAHVAAKAKTVSRKRKNAENAIETTVVISESGDAQISNEILEYKNKKFRSRTNKTETETNNKPATTVKPKGRAKKEPAKIEIPKSSSDETKTKEHNYIIETQEDNLNSKRSNKIGAQKENPKKASGKGKRNIIVKKTNDTQSEEITISQIDTNENGKAEIEPVIETKQKKKNIGRVNSTTTEKTETKGRQKKGQTTAISMNEKETTKDIVAENNIMKISSMFDTPDTNDIKNSTINKNGNSLREEKQKDEEKEGENNDNKIDQGKLLKSTIENVKTIKVASLNDEVTTSIIIDKN